MKSKHFSQCAYETVYLIILDKIKNSVDIFAFKIKAFWPAIALFV